jgi:hypothetical protein
LTRKTVVNLPSVWQTCQPTGSGLIFGVSPTIGCSSVDSFSFPERTVIKPEQINFCVGQFQNLIPQLVQQNRSPFIHCNSYQNMPPAVYQDLLGVCAMYSQKNILNQGVIFSMLDNQVFNLVKSYNPSSWSTQDYLVGIQALIMYQIIRFFDGDIRQRANAEKHSGTLEAWTIHLNSEGNNYDRNDYDSEFQRWVFVESTRRTVIMSIMVQAMYSLSKDGYCSSVPLMATLPMSMDGTLWNASEEDWWQATLGFGGALVTYQEFLKQWSGGESLYTGIFETILIVACKHNLRPPPLMAASEPFSQRIEHLYTKPDTNFCNSGAIV